MEDDDESANDFDSSSLLCEEDVGKDGEQPYFGASAKGQEDTEKGVEEEMEKAAQDQREAIEEKVAEQQLQEGAANDERTRAGEDHDGERPPPFCSLRHEEEQGMAQTEADCPMGLLAVCGQEEYYSSTLSTDCSSALPPPFCPGDIQQPRPQKRPRSCSPSSEAPPLLPLEATEPSPPVILPPAVVSLGDFQPLQVKFTQVYTTRRFTRYAARGQAAFSEFPTLPVGGSVEESSDTLRVEESTDPALMPLKPKKKMRTLYTTGQLEELERLFLDDHYPDSDKRKEIAVAIGVTPQRIMVWFQNRRAKWRKLERTSGRMDQRQNHERRGHQPIPAPQASGELQLVQASQLTPPPSQALPHYDTVLPDCPSPTGEPVGGDAEQQGLMVTGPPESAVDPLPPEFLSPPPLQRASLAMFNTCNLPNHLTPLPLDTPDSSFTVACPDSAGKNSQGSSSSLFDYDEALGNTDNMDTQHYLHSGHQGGAIPSYQVNPYPQQHSSSLLPASSLGQSSRLPFLASSPGLTPTPSDSTPMSYLPFGMGGSAGLVAYTAGGQAYFQSQNGNQYLLQPGMHGGISAIQACPWSDMYGQTSQLPPPVYHHSQYTTPSTAPGLLSSQHYVPMQRPAAGQGQSVFQPVQRGAVSSMAPLQLPPASTLYPQYQNPERADRTLPSSKMGQDPAGDYDPTPDSINQCQPPDARNTESHTAFSCDFSPINF